MSRRDPSKFSQWSPREHAESTNDGTLTCTFCGGTAVQHLAIGDGWVGIALRTGGIGYVCSRPVCKEAARDQGEVSL